MVFDENGAILQKSDYYPFGLEIDRNNPVTTPASRNNTNRYLFNGKEIQVGTGYLDYGARQYDPTVGRWMVIDPLADFYGDHTPYNYATNNPINAIDPDGMASFGVNESSDEQTSKRRGDGFGSIGKQVISECPTCPKDKAYDVYRNSKDFFHYDKKNDGVYDMNGKLVEVGATSSAKAITIPGTLSPAFRPGPTTLTIPKSLPLLIPIAYGGLADYLNGPTAIEEIAQLLEGMGVPSEVLRGPKDGIVLNGKVPPGNLTKLRNGQGWRDADGNEWKLDKLHKDHWDVTNPKTGKKVKEIDFENNQIWPDGAKNKNKR